MVEVGAEIPQDPIESKIVQSEQAVGAEMKKIKELIEIRFLPGQEERVGILPGIEDLPDHPVLARFSYGAKAPNMSTVFFDSAKGESEITGERSTREFLESQGFTGPTIQVLGKFEGTEAQIEEVDLDTVKDKTKVIGNMVFTRDPAVTLLIKPADCPTAIIYCKDKFGNPLVAIDHSGADAANAGMTRQGLWYLQDELGVDLAKAVIAVFPGVSQKHFYISQQWKVGDQTKERGNGIVERNWGEFITPKQTDDPSEKRYVDILSAFEMQAIQAGVKPENIQAYRVDTYEDVARGRAYSRRYSDENNRAHDGGQIVAVQLQKAA